VKDDGGKAVKDDGWKSEDGKAPGESEGWDGQAEGPTDGGTTVGDDLDEGEEVADVDDGEETEDPDGWGGTADAGWDEKSGSADVGDDWG
jgi:hypothetical protein